jgi:hypothetical protein
MPPGSVNALKPFRNIHAVPNKCRGLDNYIADIDSHPERNAPVFHVTDCKFMNAGLGLDSSSNRLDRA